MSGSYGAGSVVGAEPMHKGGHAVSDGGGGQTASGTWEPDPTSRHKLRWRNEAGEWTDHVYSSEGEMGNDLYDAAAALLSEQRPPQGPPTSPPELRMAEQFERFQASDSSPRTYSCYKCGHTDFVYKRDRALWHICFWIGIFLLFLTWIALPFLPKRPYCARCGAR